MTMLGGSLLHPELEAVMTMAGRHFVSIPELEVAAGKRIAEMLKLPDGYTALVTSGAAAAIQSGLAGILTGGNEALIRQLPDLTGMKSEVIIQKSHRNPFDHQLRSTGIKLVEIETRDQLRSAVNDRTAMMHFSNFANAAGQIKVDEWVKLAKQYNIPCMNDAAADTPPVSHLWDYTNMGYDLVTFSGGKAIRGPQCAGLLIGRKDLVANALLNNSPHEDTLGRSQKVGKEEIVGMVKALELFLDGRSRGSGEGVAGPAGRNLAAKSRKFRASARRSSFPTSPITCPTCRSRGTRPHFLDAATGLKTAAQFEAFHRDRRRRRTTGTGDELVHAATRRRQDRCRATFAHPARTLGVSEIADADDDMRLRTERTEQATCAGFWCSGCSSSAPCLISTASTFPSPAESIAEAYHLTDVQLGKVFSAMLVGYALFQTVGGQLADRFGPRRVLTGGVVWWGIFTALTALVPANIAGALWLFVAVRFLLGAGEAVIYPAANQFIARWIPTRERGIANGWIFAGVGAGAGLTPPLITYIMIHYGWRSSFWVCSIIGFCAGAVWFFAARDTPAEHPRVSASELAVIRSGLTLALRRSH